MRGRIVIEKRVFESIIVNAAALLLESAPFALAGALMARIPLRAAPRFAPYLGCGCGTGPAARSLPALAAAWLAFGPLVACARFAAAIAVGRLSNREPCMHGGGALTQLAAVAPFAIAGAALAPIVPAIAGAHAHPFGVAAFAAVTAFVTSPCALGAVGTAAMLRVTAPAAAIGFLCVAGIADLRAWTGSRSHGSQHDCAAYALTALACALAAARGGAALLNPRFVPALCACAVAFACFAWTYRTHARTSLRMAPLIMLAGCVLGAQPPVPVQTQTTLADAYPGERIDFAGELVRVRGAASVVRYAITCCRADAVPLSLQLDAQPSTAAPWVRVRGVLIRRDDSIRLRATSVEPVPPPADPFVYR